MNLHISKSILVLLTSPFLLAIGISAPTGAQGLLLSCEAEINKSCSDVNPGNGRLIACLYAREDQVSDSCGDAIDDVADLLDAMFADIQRSYSICAKDIEKLCAGERFGQGRILTCLNEQHAEVSPACQAVVFDHARFLAN